MGRRRLLLVVLILLGVSGVFPLLRKDLLTAEEARYVGRWEMDHRSELALSLRPDHSCSCSIPGMVFGSDTAGRWWVRDGNVFLDFEPNPIYRGLRPLLTRLGLPVRMVLHVDTSEFGFGPDRRTHYFTKADADGEARSRN
jgi:hypothetical protein